MPTPCLFPPQQKKKSNFNVKYQWGDTTFELAPHIERDFSSLVKFPFLWQLIHTGWCWVTLQEEWRSSLMFAGRLVKAWDVLVLSAGLWFTVHHWQDHWSYYNRLCEKRPGRILIFLFFFFFLTWVKCINNICFFQKKDFPMFTCLLFLVLKSCDLTFIHSIGNTDIINIFERKIFKCCHLCHFSYEDLASAFLHGLETCFK